MNIPAFLNEPVVWVFGGLAAIAVLVGVLQRHKRKRAWVTEAGARGFTYFDENGKKRPGRSTATPSETERVKSFSLRGLQRGYHVHVLTGQQAGQQVLVADYEEKKFPKELRTEIQNSSSSMTFRRTVFATRANKGSFPTLLLCRGRSYADQMDWINEDDRMDFPEDPAFAQQFTVASPTPEEARAFVSGELRAYLLRTVPNGFHLELHGRDVGVHYGKLVPPAQTGEQLKVVFEILAQLNQR